MSELDDVLALLERAVARLEAAPLRADGEALARLTAEHAERERQTAAAHAAQERQTAATAAEIVARVEAALAKIGQVLEGEG